MEVIDFHKEAEKNFNKRAYELVSLIEEFNMDQIVKQQLKGSLAYKVRTQLHTPIPQEPTIGSALNMRNARINMFEENSQKRIGFTPVNYDKFTAFLKQVYKNKTISNKITLGFLSEYSFDWILNTYKSKQSHSDYCPYLIDEIQKVLGDYAYKFEIVNLDIHRSFKIGNVIIEFLEPPYLNSKTGKKPEDERKWFLDRYSGRVYATYTVNRVEFNKGEEIALKECIKAVNVLKLFSQTVTVPEYKTDFDLDTRVSITPHSETLTENINDPKGFKILYKRRADSHIFDDRTIDFITHEANLFSQLIARSVPSELEKLLLNSINKFSIAISNHDIHKRLVDLFTIWESLLLKDQRSPIVESIKKYGTILLEEGGEAREKFNIFIEKMYNIRSEVVHHAMERDLDMGDVAGLQFKTIQLMTIMLMKCVTHQTKNTILEELDACY